MSLPADAYVTPEEYLTFERASPTKHEYFAGAVFAMSGVTRAHSLISGNLFAALHAQLRGRPCEPHASDMRVRVSETGLYTYPDVFVVCGEPEFEDAEVDTLLNPTLIVEILSPSTEAYDRGDKFAHYRTIPSLREFILVSQDRPRIERFVRQEDDTWLLAETSGLEATVTLAAIRCELRLAEVYERVVFPREVPLRPRPPIPE
jgi:Uma2 family endonuclease